MNYTVEILIEKPREEVIHKMNKLENLKHWQIGLVKAEPISGIPGEESSKIKLEYKIGKRKMILIETIIKKKLPTEFHSTYNTKGVHNIQKNYFQELKPQQTRWISECEFKFSGFTMKIMGFLMPGAFKKQSLKYMNDFKVFAEEGISVSNQ